MRMRYWFPNLALFFVLIMAVCAAICLLVSFTSSRNAQRAEGLPVLSKVTLTDSRPGREVIVEGRISDLMQPLYEDLVAYERQVYESDDDDGSWVTKEHKAPVLFVETSDGRIQLETNADTSDYDLLNPPQTMYADSDQRYVGFAPQDGIMALGTVQEGLEGPILDAEFIYGGTRAAYISEQRFASTLFFWIGIIFTIITLGLFVWYIWPWIQQCLKRR